MNKKDESRVGYRRYSDRRNALLLNIYEILFNNPDSPERDTLLLDAIQENFQTDQSAFVARPHLDTGECQITATAGNWPDDADKKLPGGIGLSKLWDIQETAPGALTFTLVKRPSVFLSDVWDNLWSDALPTSKALLSVQISPKNASPLALWLLQSTYSREWSSRDRDLSEEVAALLARARDKAVQGQC